MADSSVIAALDHLMSTYKGLHVNSLRGTLRGHWINEAFVIRLWAVLESHGFVGGSMSINKELSGAKDIDICRRLRNQIGHATGNVLDAKAQKLAQTIRTHYGLGAQDSVLDKKFILSKDTVLKPMFAAARRYCLAVLTQVTDEPACGEPEGRLTASKRPVFGQAAGRVTSSRHHLTATHYHAANLFALEAQRIEKGSARDKETLENHRAYIASAVITATCMLEAHINDLFIDAAEDQFGAFVGFPAGFVACMAKAWKEAGRGPILAKYQSAIQCAGKPRLDEKGAVFGNASALIHLRNALVHFKAEWSTESLRHSKLEALLVGRFQDSVLSQPSEPFIPGRCLGSHCALWAVQVAGDLVKLHSQCLGIASVLRESSVRVEAV